MADTFPRTFPALVDRAAVRFGDASCVRRHSGQDPDAPITYRQLRADVRRLAKGLLGLGVGRGDRVGLIAENSYAWLLADLAITYIGAADVPRGADTAPAELLQILTHSGASIAIAENDAVARDLLAMRRELPDLREVLVFGDSTEVDGVRTLGSLMPAGEVADDDPALLAAAAAVTPQDVLTIVYTSGTTADPKGVVLTHRNVLSNIAAVSRVLQVDRNDVFLSVLPAWHVYERIMDYLSVSCGGELVYTTRRKIKEDLREVAPTVFAAVPRIWESIHDGLCQHCDKLTGLKRRLMQSVVATCRAAGRGNAGPLTRLKHAVYARTLLPKIQQVTGGRLKYAVSGGGALPLHVDELLLGIGLPLLNGYGLTETSPVVCIRPPDRLRVATIGPPIPGTEVEIRDPDGRRLGPGEVGLLWVRGPQVMRGYYNNPETTRRVLGEDGWFNSGDLARMDAEGQVTITGRAKDTIVLAGGENVEPEPVETGIKASDIVDQAVVLGQDERALGAILIPRPECLELKVPRALWGEKDGELTGEPVIELMRKELDRTITRAAGFRPCERIAKFKVRLEPMTVENGLLTPTMKVKRHEVQQQMRQMIDGLFS